MNPTIRKAKAQEIPEIQRLYRQLDDHHVNLLPTVFQTVDGNARGNDVIQICIDQEDADYLLAELDGRIVGFVNIQCGSHPKYPMFRPHDFAMIENAVVAKSHRGKGIGTMLFHSAIAWAKDRDLPYVQTTVWHKNIKARKFYLDQGFQLMTVRLELDVKGDADPSAAGD